MASLRLDALVLWSANLEAAVRFYRSLGLPLEHERHGDGPLHYACDLSGVHLAIYPADETHPVPPRRGGGASVVGFQVSSVEDACTAAARNGGTVIDAPADYPWGRRALIQDPDGRLVELNHAP